MESNDRSLQVLLIEDSPGDVRLTMEAFHETNPSVHCMWRTTVQRPWPFCGMKEATAALLALS